MTVPPRGARRADKSPNQSRPKPATGPKVPNLRHHKATGRAFCIFPPDGRHVYFGKWGTEAAKAAYGRAVAEWAANGCRPPVPPDEISMAEVIERYLIHADSYYRNPKTGARTSSYTEITSALSPVLALYGHIPANDFGPMALRTVREVWIRPTEKRAGLSVTTINSYCGKVRRMLKWAASMQLIEGRVYHDVCTLSGLRRGRGEARDTTPRRTVAVEVVEATVAHMPSPLRAIIRLLLYTGARPSEILRLKRGDLDCAGEVWAARIRDHKLAYKGIDRTLYFGPRAQSVLRPFLLRPDDAYLFNPREAVAERHAAARELSGGPGRRENQKPNKKETPRVLGDHYDATDLNRAIRRVCDENDIEPWTPYQLRHTACTQIEATADIEVARAILGHADLDTTKIYLHKDHKAAVAYAALHG